MKIGLVTDSLGHLSYEDLLNVAAALGISGLELIALNANGKQLQLISSVAV